MEKKNTIKLDSGLNFFNAKTHTYRSSARLLHSGSWRGLEPIPAVPGRRLTLNIFIKIFQSPKAAKLSNSAD